MGNLSTNVTAGDAGHPALHNGERTQINTFRTAQISVKDSDYGAKGDGTTDDTAAIQSALNACPQGGIVFLPVGVYRTSSPIYVPMNVTLRGAHGASWTYRYGMPTCIKPLATFSGAAVLRLRDKEEVDSGSDQGGQRLFDITLDGSALPAGTVHGLYATGFVGGVVIDRVAIAYMTGIGFYTNVYTRLDTNNYYPRGWYVSNVKCEWNDGNNWELHNMTDCSFVMCLAHNSVGGDGFHINGSGDAHFTDCRATWNNGKGFRILGVLGGALCFTSCTTDRSEEDGFYVGTVINGPIVFTGCQARRDGRNSDAGGGGWAGFATNNTASQIRYSGCAVSPGVNDPGMSAATMSPQYAIRHTGSADVAHSAGYYWAFSGIVNDGGSNTLVRFDPSCTGGTGDSSGGAAPTADRTLGGWSFRQYKTKTADQVVNNSTTLVNVTDLVATVAANQVYDVTLFLIYDASLAADLKIAWTAPTGATMDWVPAGPGTGTAGGPYPLDIGIRAVGGQPPLGAVGVGTKIIAIPRGRLVVGGTSGSLQLQFAQQVADATNATVYAGSYLRLERI